VFSVEQSAILEAIQWEKNSRHKKVILIDFLSTIMATENRTPTKNPKTRTMRKMLDNEGPRITLLWVPSHVGILGIEKADQVLDEDNSTTEINPPDDLKK
jgi:ribonuclease HI